MLSMDFKNIEVYKLYRLISCLDFKKIDVVFELQRIDHIVSIDAVFGFQIGFYELCKLYLLMLCLDFS